MKKRITTIALLILIINISFAQQNETFLDINQVHVEGITYKTSISEMKKILGEPLSYEKYIDEDYGDNPSIYEYFDYKDIYLHYIENGYMDERKLEHIEIKNEHYVLNVSNKQITVGDDIKKIKEILPYEYESFIKKHPEIKVYKEYRIIGGNLTYGGLEPVNMVFWIKNNKITKITIGFPMP